MCDRRAERARVLARRLPESAEALSFYGAIASFQKDASPSKLLELVSVRGPELLRQLAAELDENGCAQAARAWAAGEDRSSPTSFFGRVLLQVRTARDPHRSGDDGDCPSCGHPPQVGCRVREGDGTALLYSCSICFNEWRPRDKRCPACGSDELAHYHAPEIEHLELQACDGCRTYLNVVRRDAAPEAVPDVDEIAALPLDVWAVERGYRKLVRNLVGV